MFASIHFQMIWLSFGLFLCYALIIWLSILFNPFFQMLKKICLHENIVSFVFVFEFHESPEKHCSIWGSWRKNLPCRPRSTRKNTLVPCLVRNLLGQFWRKKTVVIHCWKKQWQACFLWQVCFWPSSGTLRESFLNHATVCLIHGTASSPS